jgi:hypothetical protein
VRKRERSNLAPSKRIETYVLVDRCIGVRAVAVCVREIESGTTWKKQLGK